MNTLPLWRPAWWVAGPCRRVLERKCKRGSRRGPTVSGVAPGNRAEWRCSPSADLVPPPSRSQRMPPRDQIHKRNFIFLFVKLILSRPINRLQQRHVPKVYYIFVKMIAITETHSFVFAVVSFLQAIQWLQDQKVNIICLKLNLKNVLHQICIITTGLALHDL